MTRQLIEKALGWCEAFKWDNFDDDGKVDEGLVSDLADFAALAVREREREIAEEFETKFSQPQDQDIATVRKEIREYIEKLRSGG